MILKKVNIAPLACPRPRINRKTGGVYYPKSYTDWRHDSSYIIKSLGLDPIEDKNKPITLHVMFYLKGVVAQEHTKKPDLDNLIKAFMDLLVDSGLLPDDAQIHDIRASKHHLPAGIEPCIYFAIEETIAVYNQFNRDSLI